MSQVKDNVQISFINSFSEKNLRQSFLKPTMVNTDYGHHIISCILKVLCLQKFHSLVKKDWCLFGLPFSRLPFCDWLTYKGYYSSTLKKVA